MRLNVIRKVLKLILKNKQNTILLSLNDNVCLCFGPFKKLV